MASNAHKHYVLGHSSDELDRLIAQSRFFGELSEQLLTAAGICAGNRPLDIGCGAGDLSFLLAKLVGPAGEVVGIDRSAEAIALAQKRAHDAGLHNVHFVTGDIGEFASNATFDAIVGRLVLMYLDDPVPQLRKLARNLKPGGTFAFHEIYVQGASSHPHLPLLQTALERIAETFHRADSDPSMGLRLPQLFRDAGLPPPSTLVHTRLAACDETSLFQQLAAITRTLVPAMERFGVATAAEVDVDTLAERLTKDCAEHDATVVGPLFVGAWARI